MTQTMTTSRTTATRAHQDVQHEYSTKSLEEICQAIGAFHDDPPDTNYQRAYLVELKLLVRECLKKEFAT